MWATVLTYPWCSSSSHLTVPHFSAGQTDALVVGYLLLPSNIFVWLHLFTDFAKWRGAIVQSAYLNDELVAPLIPPTHKFKLMANYAIKDDLSSHLINRCGVQPDNDPVS